MAASIDKFSDAITQSKIPILVLDNKWHKLFGKIDPPQNIKGYADDLTRLMKQQGKLVNENKELKKIKSDLMSEIVANMDGEDKALTDKKLSDNKKLINDVNDRLADNEDKLIELPREIDSINKKLMLATMEVCYERLKANTEEIEEIGEWIKNIRIQLKRNIVKKQDKEIYNAELYSYMHDIFGPSVMELFDMKYVPTIHRADDSKGASNINNQEKSNSNE